MNHLVVVAAIFASIFPTKHINHVHKHHRHHRTRPIEVVEGRTSTFGYPAEDGTVAGGGNTQQPCIAIREDWSLGRWFTVKVLVGGRWHKARLKHCDWGPASWTGRAIDITGEGVQRLGFSQAGYPTGAWGIATLRP